MKNFIILETESDVLKSLLGLEHSDIVIRKTKATFSRAKLKMKKSEKIVFSVHNTDSNPSIVYLGVEALVSGNRIVEMTLNFSNKKDQELFEISPDYKKNFGELKRILAKILNEGKKISLD